MTTSSSATPSADSDTAPEPQSSITLPDAASPDGVTVSPDGATLYVSDRGQNAVLCVDVATSTVTATLPTVTYPSGLTLLWDAKVLMVVSPSPPRLELFDVTTDPPTSISSANLGFAGSGVSFDTSTSQTALAVPDQDTVVIMDPGGMPSTHPVLDVGHPTDVAVDVNRGLIWVTNLELSEVSIVDIASFTVQATVPVAPFPYGVAVGPDGRIYVTHQAGSVVSTIDPANGNAVTATPILANQLQRLTVGPDGAVYVVDWVGEIYVFAATQFG